ncbi:MAG: glycosyl transferase family 1, partial [Acidobacteriota bacterium]
MLRTFGDNIHVTTFDLSTSDHPTDPEFDAIRILPLIDPVEVHSVLDKSPIRPRARVADVICFSIIDWTSRYQRPQQMMSQYAAHGHRVFYIDLVRFRPPSAEKKVAVNEIKPNIYGISLTSISTPQIYSEVIEGKNLELLMLSLEELRCEYGINQAVCYIMIASWAPLALEMRERFGWKIIYDCMDEWENFPLIKQPVVEMEESLARDCDLLVVTAARLFDKWQHRRGPTVLARNAADYEFFDERCLPNSLLGDVAHPIVGYYGAIAEWFDLDLMTAVAEARPYYTFVIIGGVYNVDVSRLRASHNVRFLGHRPYETMPEYLYHFDACIIPFKINQITESTDPVK